jgi:hypothetical protein
MLDHCVPCPICKKEKELVVGDEHDQQYWNYNEKFDSFYCKDCDYWLEEKCDEHDCEYCIKRPEKPSKVVNEFY